MAKIICKTCGNVVSGEEDTCTYCGNALNKEEVIEETLAENNDEQPKPNIVFRIFKFFFPVIFMVVLTFALVRLFNGESKSDEELYAELKEEMEYYDGDSQTVKDIDYYLKHLSKDYEDVSKIKLEWDLIKQYTNDLNAVNKNNVTNESADKAREAFVKLQDLADNNEDWNLKKYLSNQISSVLFGLKWENNLYWLMWHDVTGVRMFADTFPNNKSRDKGYLFSMQDRGYEIDIIYTNFEDSTDKLTTLVLSNIKYEDGYFSLIVKCNANDMEYIVKTAYSI